MANRSVAFGVESTYGTSVARTRFLEVLSEDFRTERNTEIVETIDRFGPADMVELNSLVRGSFRHKLNFNGMGFLFEHLIGSVTKVGAADPYTHTFPATTGIPVTDRIGLSLSIEVNRDTDVWVYAGCKIVSLEITLDQNGSGEANWEWVGRNEATGGAATAATFPTREIALSKNASLNWNSGGSDLPTMGCTVRIENPLDEPFLYGASEIGGSGATLIEPARAGVLAASMSAQVLFQNLTDFYDDFDGTTKAAMVWAVTDNAANSHDLTVTMPQFMLTQATPPMSGRERLVSSVEGTGVYSTDATENVQIVLNNEDAAT